MKRLKIENTGLSADAVAELRKALPDCTIYSEPLPPVFFLRIFA